MNKTLNYQLSQWDKSDRVLMDDFNADNAKIDAALKSEADSRRALQSAVNSLQTTVSKKQDASAALKITVGSYTGNGSSSQTISLPFVPKAVFVIPVDGGIYSSASMGYTYGGLAVTGSPGRNLDNNTLEISGSGFKVYYAMSTRTISICLNQADKKYNYIAFC